MASSFSFFATIRLVRRSVSVSTRTVSSLHNKFTRIHDGTTTTNFGGIVLWCRSRTTRTLSSSTRRKQRPQQRPPFGSLSMYPRESNNNNKLRTHGVSILEGDYHEYDDDEQDDVDQDMDDFDDDEEDTSNMSKADRKMLEDAREQDELYQKKKERWMELTRPVVRVSKIDDRGRAYGRGSRKTAQARVWIQPGLGEVVVNRRPFEEYFRRNWHREHVLAPLVATDTCGDFDVQCHVEGGGLSGKAGAIRMGLARALQHYNPEYRPPLKRLGLLTRDPRMVERKKIGKVKARKSPQWVRR